MAGQNSYLNLDSSQRKYPGSPEWDAAFPNGVRSVSTPLPEGTDLGQGYIPPPSGPNTNPNNGGNPMIDPTTGKKWSTT